MFSEFLQNIFTKKAASIEELYSVDFDGESISTTYPNGEKCFLLWKSLQSVEVHTNDTGPWGLDVWFVLKSSSSEVSFPLGAKGQNSIFRVMEELEGFEMKGMNSTDNEVFICWQK